MKPVTFLILVNLVAVIFLLFWSPELMISPGGLIEGHQEFTTDCFACHTLGKGSPARKCIVCHSIAKIGKVTTKGLPVKQKAIPVPFHQELLEQNCVACHSDHRGVKIYRVIKQFSHELLMESSRKNCDRCHSGPQDKLHQKVTINCSLCHTHEKWKPATFKHELLTEPVRKVCENCHSSPEDSLHQKIVGNCVLCHDENRWSPATFEHDKYFQLDSDHDTDCVTCHEDNLYQKYTCYGCHEHNPSNIQNEHYEEGIYNYERCTQCHRSADKDEAKRNESSSSEESSRSSDGHGEGEHEEND